MGAKTKQKPKNSGSLKPRKSLGGFFIFVSMIVVIAAASGVQYYFIRKQNEELVKQNAELDIKKKQNQSTLAEIGYLEANKNHIESVWSGLRNSLPGPFRADELAPFPELANVNNEFNATGASPGFLLFGERAEFQRVAGGVADLESRYPLIQFTQIKLALPDETNPMPKAPTYLRMRAELYMPRQ